MQEAFLEYFKCVAILQGSSVVQSILMYLQILD